MPRRRWSEQQMRELLKEHERSGISLNAFAGAAGIPYPTLAWWRTRLRREGVPHFVPVQVHDELADVEIVVGDVVVRVARGTDVSATARLVRAIASC